MLGVNTTGVLESKDKGWTSYVEVLHKIVQSIIVFYKGLLPPQTGSVSLPGNSR